MATVPWRSTYTLDASTPRPALEAALRGALTAMRDDMEYLSITFGPDYPVPPEVQASMSQLDLPHRWRDFLKKRSRRGFSDDLDPRDPVEFEVGSILAPFAEHAMSISRGGAGEFASYEAAVETRLTLSEQQYLATCRYMTAAGCDPRHLVKIEEDA